MCIFNPAEPHISISASNVVKLYNDVSTNSIETKTNLTLRVQVTNNADYLNSIIFQNTATFKTTALTRRYDSSMSGGSANFCIQNGNGGTLSDTSHPIRFCVGSSGQVDIGSSQTKTHGFNVEGTRNFEDLITGTSMNIVDSYKIDGIDVLHDASISSVKSFILNARIIQKLNSSQDGLFINYMTGGRATNAHCRFYSGGNTTERMWIGADGKIGINTVNPTEIFDVNGISILQLVMSIKLTGQQLFIHIMMVLISQ